MVCLSTMVPGEVCARARQNKETESDFRSVFASFLLRKDQNIKIQNNKSVITEKFRKSKFKKEIKMESKKAKRVSSADVLVATGKIKEPRKSFGAARNSTSSLKQRRVEFKARQKMADFEAEAGPDPTRKATPRSYFAPKRRSNLLQKFDQLSESKKSHCVANLLNRFDDQHPGGVDIDAWPRTSEEEDSIWSSRGLSTWDQMSRAFQAKNYNMIDKDFVRNVFNRKYSRDNGDECASLSDLVKKSKTKTNDNSPVDSGIAVTPTTPGEGKTAQNKDGGSGDNSSETDVLQNEIADELEDLESFFTDEEDLADDSSEPPIILEDAKEVEQPKETKKIDLVLPECETISSDEEWN